MNNDKKQENIVDILSGGIKFTNQSCKIDTFVCGNIEGKYVESPPFVLLKNKELADKLNVSVIKKFYMPSRSGVSSNVGGFLATTAVKLNDIKKEVVLKFVMTERLPSGNTTIGIVFGVIRRGGALGILTAPKFIKGDKVGSRIIVSKEPKIIASGNIELISMKKATELYGVQISPVKRASCNEQVWSKIMSFDIIQEAEIREGQTRITKVLNSKGEEIEITKRVRVRNLTELKQSPSIDDSTNNNKRKFTRKINPKSK